MVLILLNLRDNFSNFPPFGEVDKIRIMEKIWVSLLQEKDVGLIFPKEGDARRVDRS